MTNLIPIGILTISDRANSGIYEDKSGPTIVKWINEKFLPTFKITSFTVPDEFELIRNKLNEWVEDEFGLIITTGGTGPAARDITPEATKAIISKVLPGFGEQMRAASLKDVPTAILSRQIAGIANDKTLIVNLPGAPKSIYVCLNAIEESISPLIKILGHYSLTFKKYGEKNVTSHTS